MATPVEKSDRVISNTACAFVLLVLVCGILVTQGLGCSESVGTKRISKSTLDVLRSQFLMSEAFAIIRASRTRSSSKAYLQSYAGRFKFLVTQPEPPFVLEGYSVQDMTSPIIGYSLRYAGADGPLAVLDAAVNPLVKDAVASASQLIFHSLQPVSKSDGYSTYFLGIYDVDSAGILKIWVLLKRQTSIGPEYHIRYIVQIKYKELRE